jgi:membrane protein YqaA with SNARE-associated domain
MYSFQSFSIAKEKSIGTFRYLIYFILLNAVTGICFIPISIFAGLNQITSNPLLNVRLHGLWACIMAELIMDSHSNSEKEVSFLCFNCKLKNKYYPWVLFIVFSLIGGAIFMLIAGIMTGYICKGYLDAFGLMNWTKISDSWADWVEGKIFCCCFRSKRFVTTAECEFEMQGNERASGLPRAQNFQHVPFAGQGIRLGD